MEDGCSGGASQGTLQPGSPQHQISLAVCPTPGSRGYPREAEIPCPPEQRGRYHLRALVAGVALSLLSGKAIVSLMVPTVNNTFSL